MPDQDKWSQFEVDPNKPPATSTPDKWAQFEVAKPAPKPNPSRPNDRIADSLENATISPPETGIAASIDRFKNRVRDFMGADHKPAGDILGGGVLGPINVAHGAAITPSHPVRGAHEVISGVGQTLALPMAVVNPGTMAYAAPSIIAGTGAKEGLKALGADKDWADLGGDAAGIYAGVKTLNPNAMKVPVRKLVQTGMAINEGIPGLNRLNKLAEAPGKIREIWRKPEPQGEATAAGPVDGGPPPAPYRKSGSQIQDATTVMPRRIQTDPTRLLGTGTESGPVESEPETTITPLRATTPKAAQTEVLKKMGVAAPSATVKPMTRIPAADITPRPDLKFSGSLDGEDAAMNQLTENVTPDRLGINELRAIAQQRGIKVSPGDNHAALYRKIQDTLTPEEIDRFEQARIERIQPDYSLPPITEHEVELLNDEPRVPKDDADMENLLMRSIQRLKPRAKSAKAGDD